MTELDVRLTAMELHAIVRLCRVAIARIPGQYRASPDLRRQAKKLERKAIKALRAYGEDVE